MKATMFLFTVLSPTQIGNRKSKIASSNHPICSRQDVGRDCETDLLGCLQIDHKFELRWLFDRQIRGLAAFEDLIHVCGGTAVTVSRVRPIRHESTCIYELP